MTGDNTNDKSQSIRGSVNLDYVYEYISVFFSSLRFERHAPSRQNQLIRDRVAYQSNSSLLILSLAVPSYQSVSLSTRSSGARVLFRFRRGAKRNVVKLEHLKNRTAVPGVSPTTNGNPRGPRAAQ